MVQISSKKYGQTEVEYSPVALSQEQAQTLRSMISHFVCQFMSEYEEACIAMRAKELVLKKMLSFAINFCGIMLVLQVYDHYSYYSLGYTDFNFIALLVLQKRNPFISHYYNVSFKID